MAKKVKNKKVKPVKDINLKVSNIQPKNQNQKEYLKSIEDYPVTFGIGCAGTGKTLLACFAAAKMLADSQIKRVILVRPVVEAGESLGFLPGDIDDKLAPYVQPLNDSFIDIIGFQKTKDYIKDSVISIIPLAFMRGRTLTDSFVILDEAQNTTIKQMKMFLTRLGENSKFVINGDITQIDLKKDNDSGLIDGYKRLQGVNGVNFVNFTQRDIVRHPVVEGIVEAYETVLL